MSSRVKSLSTEAIVIKRTSIGEADRIVTLLTKEQGKMATVAKGVRQLKSSKRAFLEPGSHIKCQLITTHSLPILTQATLLSDVGNIRDNLLHVRQLLQLLEIVDTLFVEEQGEHELFSDVLTLRTAIVSKQGRSELVRDQLAELINKLGYQPFADTQYQTITEYVAALADRPLKTWEYLKV